MLDNRYKDLIINSVLEASGKNYLIFVTVGDEKEKTEEEEKKSSAKKENNFIIVLLKFIIEVYISSSLIISFIILPSINSTLFLKANCIAELVKVEFVTTIAFFAL